MPKIKELSISTYKYDGSLKDTYHCKVIEENDDYLVLFTAANPNNQQDGIVELQFKRRWFNVRHICEQVNFLNHSYVNLATPCKVNNTHLVWTDLDLDYRLHLDGSVEQLDTDEFEKHKILMNYPEELVNRVHKACLDIEQGFVTKQFPFNHSAQVKCYFAFKEALAL